MRAHEVRELSEEEMRRKELDTREELFNLRIQKATQQITNTARIKELRRDLARILTVKRERELRSESASGESSVSE